MVSKHCIECGNVKTQDVIEVVKVIQVLGYQICQASSATVAVFDDFRLHTHIDNLLSCFIKQFTHYSFTQFNFKLFIRLNFFHSFDCKPQQIKQIINSLYIAPDAVLQLKDVITNEPHQVRKVGGRGSVTNELQHRAVIHTVHIQGQGPYSNAHHTLRMVEKLDGLGIEWEVIGVLWG